MVCVFLKKTTRIFIKSCIFVLILMKNVVVFSLFCNDDDDADDDDADEHTVFQWVGGDRSKQVIFYIRFLLWGFDVCAWFLVLVGGVPPTREA